MLKTYACLPENTKGRIYPEKPTPYRNEFERDRDRIIHTNAFKRLQYKTQVFVNHEGDHYRNRLTHSVEVSSIARSLAKALGVCEDLAEAVALAHDMGHAPFGHAGEDALNACMEKFGGFSHNAHSFKLLTSIEKKYAAYDGLNLTWEVLEGIVKHNGPVEYDQEAYSYIYQYDAQHSLDLDKYSSIEAQVAALADDIAYISHDLEDSIKAKIISYEDLSEIDFIAQYIQQVQNAYPQISEERLIYEVARKFTHYLIESLLKQTRANIQQYNITSPAQVRELNQPLVCFTTETTERIKLIKSFLYRKVYKHHRVASVTFQCKHVIKDLFNLYAENIELLPFHWTQHLQNDDEHAKMRIIADYIAGMTDRFAIKQYQTFYNFNFANIGL